MENIPMPENSVETTHATAEQNPQPAAPQFTAPAQPRAPYPPQYQPQPRAPYPPQYQPQPQAPVATLTKDPDERKGVAVTGFVFGVLGMLFSGVPVLNFILALVSIICSGVGRAKGGSTARAYGAAGLTVGILTAVAVVAQIILVASVISLIKRIMAIGGAITDFEDFLYYLPMLMNGGMY